MRVDIKPIKLVFIITERKYGKKLGMMLNENGYDIHNAFLGRGTAPDELSAYLGLGEPEKVIFTCFVDNDRAKELLELLDKDFFSGDSGGLAFTIPVSSASNIDVVKLITDLRRI